MKIRSANPEDAAAIAHVHVASWRVTYSGIIPERYLADLDETDFTRCWSEWLEGGKPVTICVAEREGALVGFAAGGPIRKPVSHCDSEIYSIYLLPVAQRIGLGRRLVSCIEEKLLKQGQSNLLAWVLRDNPATSFYQRLGGQLVAEASVEIGGVHLPEVAFAWRISALRQSPETEVDQTGLVEKS